MRPDRATLETVFENAPRFVDRIRTRDDYTDWPDVLYRAEMMAFTKLRAEEIDELINGHPRIGAVPSSVSATSFREQGYDRDSGTADLKARLDRLNEHYEQRFGFRFVVFVNGRSRQEIADFMESRLSEQRGVERERALYDVFAIARDRVSKLPVSTAEGAS